MRDRQDLSILQFAHILTNSAEMASVVVEDRKREAKEQEKVASRIPWGTLLAAGTSIMAIWSYMQEVEDEVKELTGGTDDAAPVDTEVDTGPVDIEGQDDGQSLLDTVVSWLNKIPESKATPKERPMPLAPAITSTNKGATLLGPPAPETRDGAVAQHIRGAAATVGIDPNVVFAIAKVESNFNVGALNKITGASGMLQFTPKTWAYLIGKYSHLGYTQADINDPEKQAMIGALYIKEISEALGKTLGRAPSPTEIYLGHFLGITGARKFLAALAANPGASAATVMPAAAKANHNIFYKDNQPLSLTEVMARLDGKIAPNYNRYSTTGTPTELAEGIPSTTQVGSAVPSAANALPMASGEPTQINGKLPAGAGGGAGGTQVAQSSGAVPSSGGTPQRPTEYIRTNTGKVMAIPISG